MIDLLLRLVMLFQDPRDVEALRRTAPSYLSAESAATNLAAARIAGALYGISPDLALSIAWHESRYQPDTITPEVGGLVSCGSMTPVPIARCPAQPTMLDGYLAGAAHLRGWLQAQHGDLDRALIGYAGGYALIAMCARGEAPRACTIARVFQARAWRIRHARELRGAS